MFGTAREQHPDRHWLDTPVDPDAEPEEETQERRPASTFTDKQTVFVLLTTTATMLREFPISGDEKHTGNQFDMIGHRGTVYGYVLNRRPEFKHKFYGWALDR